MSSLRRNRLSQPISVWNRRVAERPPSVHRRRPRRVLQCTVAPEVALQT